MTDLITPLDEWLKVVRQEDICREELIRTTDELVHQLQEIRVALPGEDYPRKLHPQFSQANHIVRSLIDLSGSFLWGNYTDSDTDAPCDLEWDVHHLQRDLNPAHVIPEDVEPAYVMGTVYPTPEDEDEE